MDENSRYISDRDKVKILKRDRNSCRYCGIKNVPFEFDHVYPYIKGGETSVHNIVLACSPCNKKKRDKVGIWPMPIGYFEYKPHVNLPDVSLVSFSLVLVGNGVWNIINPVWFSIELGKASLLIGVLFLSITLARMILGR